MNLLGFLSALILVITIITVVFGLIAYFLYKARERKKQRLMELTYEEVLMKEGGKYVFFE